MFVAACFWGAGFLIGALGIATRQLWLLCLGYGVAGGIGLGIGDISPCRAICSRPTTPGTTRASPAPTPAHALVMLFMTLGIGYFAVMMLGVANVRVPPPGWAPAGFDSSSVKRKPMVTTTRVSAANAVRAPQFWLMWVAVLQRDRRHRRPGAGEPDDPGLLPR
jgi:hypothetical protein